ncbi:MAG: hypothetical protein RLZZ312_135 [Bacteroidota bacterium]|jgi:hypothetical protein
MVDNYTVLQLNPIPFSELKGISIVDIFINYSKQISNICNIFGSRM